MTDSHEERDAKAQLGMAAFERANAAHSTARAEAVYAALKQMNAKGKRVLNSVTNTEEHMMNDVSNRPQSGARTMQDLRLLIAQDDGQTAATTELAKLGIKISDLNLDAIGQGGNAGLRAVGACRRALNQLADAAQSASVDAAGRKRILAAAEWIGAHIAISDKQRALDAEAAAAFGVEPRSDAVRDTSGKRIGVLLTASDLRDVDKIAAKLGADHSQPFLQNSEPMTLGGFVRGVAGMRVSESVRNALSEGTNADGGYAVPTILLPGILQALVPASSLLNAGAGIVMLDRMQAKTFSVAAVNAIPTAGWRLENGAVAESQPTFRAVQITPQSMAFVIRVSRELLQDAPGLEQALETAIAQAVAVGLDKAGLLGNGTAPNPLGLLNIAGVNTVNFGGANGGALTSYAAFVQARGAIIDQNGPEPNAVITSTRDNTTLAGLVDTLGQPLRKPDILAGWKFASTTQIPVDSTVGTSDDCSTAFVGNFASFNFYLREGLSLQLLRETYAASGQIGFLCHVRADVAASYPKALTIVKGLRPAA